MQCLTYFIKLILYCGNFRTGFSTDEDFFPLKVINLLRQYPFKLGHVLVSTESKLKGKKKQTNDFVTIHAS